MADDTPTWAQDDAPTWAQDAPQGNAANWGPTTEILNGAMFGMLPAAEGWIGNHVPSLGIPSTEQLQADRDAYAKEHPYIGGAANIAGEALPYLAAGEAAAPLGLAGRAAAMGATGAAGSSLQPLSQGQDPTEAAVLGGATGVAGELGGSVLAGAGGKLADALLNRGVNIPASSALKSTANAQYDALRANPTQFPLSEGQQLAQDTLDTLGNKGLYTKGPGTVEIFKKLLNPQGSMRPGDTAVGVTAGGLEEARQNLNNIIRNNPRTDDAAAATLGKQSIDQFLQARSSDPNVQQFLSDAANARGNWRAHKASDIVTNNIDRATGQASTNLADNSNQLISKRAHAILQQPRLSGGMAPDELSALENLRSGNPVRNLAQSIGAATGHTGIGLAVAAPEIAALYAEHGLDPHILLPAAATMGVGMGAHKLANALAERQGRGVAELIRSHSPMFQDMISSGASAAPVNVGPTTEAARKLSSALAASSGNQLYAP